jgi:alpha-ketoglutarate-dependent taurine dioxygenase
VIVPLAAGDVLLLDNTAILHNRLAYVDTPETEGRRRLLRGWVRRDRTSIASAGER